MSRPRITAAGRIQRLLAMLQWASTHPDGVPIEDLCARFAVAPGDLVKELEMASMIGADSPHYDDMPFEVFVEDGRVYVRLFSFDRPLRLSPAEGLALVVAADALTDPSEPDAPLGRALAKLGAVLGIAPGEAVDVDLDPDGGRTGRALREAIASGGRVRFRYWTYGRDAVAEREVSPWQLFAEEGTWYLTGLAHDRDAERRFRLDRMEEVQSAPGEAVPPPAELSASIDLPDDGPRAVLDLAPDARWVAEAYPIEAAEEIGEGRLRVTIVVAGPSWLERLLVRLGPSVQIHALDPELGGPDLSRVVARRILDRYRDGASRTPR